MSSRPRKPENTLRFVLAGITCGGIVILLGVFVWLKDPAIFTIFNNLANTVNTRPSSSAASSTSTAAAANIADTQLRLEQVSAQLETLNQQVALLNAQLRATEQAHNISATTTAATIGINPVSQATIITATQMPPIPTLIPTRTAVRPTAPSPPATAANQPDVISAKRATEVAIAYRKNGSVREIKLERKNTGWVYEVKLSDGSKIYVDAVNGRVVYAEIKSETEDD